MTKTYKNRRDAGICTLCGRVPAAPGRVTCVECAEKRKAYEIAKRHEYVQNRRCGSCGAYLPDGWYYYNCEYCQQKASILHHIKYAKRQAEGLCPKCGKPFAQEDGNFKTCSACRAARREYHKRWAATPPELEVWNDT